jgi:uncharacterized RDD family membrane protein YckC
MRGIEALRQSAHQSESSSAWKQEVNRRVAQHQGRKGAANSREKAAAGAEQQGDAFANKTGALSAAARVAARYAKAPSYSEMIAREARAEMRLSEAATLREPMAPTAAVALPNAEPTIELAYASNSAPIGMASSVSAAPVGQPAGAAILPNIETENAIARPVGDVHAQSSISLPPGKPAISERPFEIRWDSDLPVREAAQGIPRAFRGSGIYEVDAAAVSRAARGVHAEFECAEPEVVEPAQPIHANLIHFPRELVALNKARPRRAEGLPPVSEESQLSIFEAEPGTVCVATATAKAVTKTVAPTWTGTERPSSQRNDKPAWETASQASPDLRTERVELSASRGGRVAPVSRRILAAMMDFSIVAGAFLAAAIVGIMNTTVMPPLRELELGSGVALVLIAVFYQALFFGLSRATPGMQYAGLELCTFAGKRPALGQRFVRALALVVSLLPFGLGFAWALFDGQELSWHDRLSGTYLRKA